MTLGAIKGEDESGYSARPCPKASTSALSPLIASIIRASHRHLPECSAISTRATPPATAAFTPTPSTGLIAGSGIAASRSCRSFEGCQAVCQSEDQILVLLDRSVEVGQRLVGLDVPGGGG